MSIDVSHLIKVSTQKYNAWSKFYASEAGLKQALDYETWIYNGIIRYIDSGDPTHLNRLVVGARNMGKVRLTTKLMKDLSAHPYNSKTRQFDGKMAAGKMRNLKKLGEDGVALKMAKVLDNEQDEEQSAGKEWDMDSLIKTVVNQLSKNEANVVDFVAKLQVAAEKKAA